MDHLTFCLKKFSLLYREIAPLIAQAKPKKLPLIDGEKWVAELDLGALQDLFIYGVGKGEIYGALKKWLHQKTTRILFFIEDDMEILRALFETDLGKQILTDDQVELLYCNLDKPAPLFQRLMWQGVSRKRVILKDPRSSEVTLQKIHNVLQYDQDKIQWVSLDYQVFGLGYYYNYYQNLKELPNCYDGSALFGKAKNIPAIIVGAGPSLDKNGQYLQNLEDKAIIFAGGSSLPAIKQFGIQPNFGGGIDPNIWQCERLMSYGKVDFPFLFCSRMNAPALKLIQGPKVFIPGTGGYDTEGWMNGKLGLPKILFKEGYSIIHFMTEIAYYMGCNPIVYVGVDLSYPNNVHYAKGVTQPEELPNDLIGTTDIHGNQIVSRWMWIKEAIWISEFAKAHPATQFINATEGGIGYKDVINKSLLDVVNSFEVKSSLGSYLVLERLKVTSEEISKTILPLIESLERTRNILDEMERFYQKIDLVHYNQEDIHFPEGGNWYEKLQQEEAFDPILKIFHTYCISLIANSHTSYLITRDGFNSKLVRQVVQLHLQKVHYLREVVKGQIKLLHSQF